jgi:hypothetical protein
MRVQFGANCYFIALLRLAAVRIRVSFRELGSTEHQRTAGRKVAAIWLVFYLLVGATQPPHFWCRVRYWQTSSFKTTTIASAPPAVGDVLF